MENIKQANNEECIKDIHKLTSSDACITMNSREEGLTASEAEERLKTYGKNVITEKKGKSPIIIFLSNFVSLMAILLWVGGIIAFLDKCQNWLLLYGWLILLTVYSASGRNTVPVRQLKLLKNASFICKSSKRQ